MPAAPKPPADSQAGQQAPLYATKKANKLNPKYDIPGVKIAASRKPRGIKKAKDDVKHIVETQQRAAPKPTKVTPTTITETAHKRQQAEEITGTATKKPRMVAVAKAMVDNTPAMRAAPPPDSVAPTGKGKGSKKPPAATAATPATTAPSGKGRGRPKKKKDPEPERVDIPSPPKPPNPPPPPAKRRIKMNPERPRAKARASSGAAIPADPPNPTSPPPADAPAAAPAAAPKAKAKAKIRMTGRRAEPATTETPSGGTRMKPPSQIGMASMRTELRKAIEANTLSKAEAIQFNFLEQASKSNIGKEAKAATVKDYRKLYANTIYKAMRQNTRGNI